MSTQPEWKATSKAVAPNFYQLQHLVRESTGSSDKGWQDTACGASGTPGSFTRRANRGKPKCPECKRKEKR